jgi:Xaa-Pro aminopeptidase
MNRQLEKGDQVAILIEAADPAGFYTHLVRIACIGGIPEELQQHWEDAKEAQKISLRMLKPGADPMEMLRANNEFLKSKGYPEEHRLYAHAQGYDLVERPAFQPGETMKIRAGMNVAPHPTVSSRKAAAVVCDNYVITETGVSECLHKTPKEIFVV